MLNLTISADLTKEGTWGCYGPSTIPRPWRDFSSKPPRLRSAISWDHRGFLHDHLIAIQQSPCAPELDELLSRYQIPPDEREAWGAVVHGIAVATPPGVTIHEPTVPPGQAMARAGVTGEEVEELVGGTGSQFVATLAKVCAKLRAAGQGVDCVALAGLVLTHYPAGHPRRETHAVKVSRHFAIASRGSA